MPNKNSYFIKKEIGTKLYIYVSGSQKNWIFYMPIKVSYWSTHNIRTQAFRVNFTKSNYSHSLLQLYKWYGIYFPLLYNYILTFKTVAVVGSLLECSSIPLVENPSIYKSRSFLKGQFVFSLNKTQTIEAIKFK